MPTNRDVLRGAESYQVSESIAEQISTLDLAAISSVIGTESSIELSPYCQTYPEGRVAAFVVGNLVSAEGREFFAIDVSKPRPFIAAIWKAMGKEPTYRVRVGRPDVIYV